MPTINEAINEAARRLELADESGARRTAGLLLAHRLGVDRTHLFTHPEDTIDESDYETLLQMIQRRAAGEPVQYITGHQEFYGLDFIVTPDVLIPRPETEFLVDRVLKLVADSGKETPLIVDVGTGSGCIAVALAVQIPRARIIATDVSDSALEVARTNAARHGVRDHIEFLNGDLLSPLAEVGMEGAVDVLASNPPYVNEGRPELIQREVRDWEPHEALFGGTDGLEFYRRLVADGSKYLKPSGYLVLEIGYTQLDPISEIIEISPLKLVDVTRDLQGIPRTLTLRKS